MQLQYHRLHEDVPPLEYATTGSACFDIRCHFNGNPVRVYEQDGVVRAGEMEGNTLHLHPGQRALIPTGIAFDIPKGFALFLYNRSSTGLKRGLSLANGVGVIDSDYTDEVYIPMLNTTNVVVPILDGDRLAQVQMTTVFTAELVAADAPIAKKDSRDGGFGSTGVR